jgi:purine-binding chemotaxis protein CheW
MSTTLIAERQTQYLTFRLAGEEYAIGILGVREIIEFDTLTTVPSAPAHVRGVINLRGSVVPVIDLALKFGLPPTPVTRRSCVVIVDASFGGELLTMGVIAEAVNQVVDLTADDILPPPAFGTSVPTEHLLGMGRQEKGFLLILDIDRVLSAAEQRDVAALDAAAGVREGDAAA